MNQINIRNFCVVAHIDHGKSTLADRLLELTGTVQKRDMQEQVLDSNPIERERGITIKLAPVRMIWKTRDMENVLCIKENQKNQTIIHNTNPIILNLIDTPGHVDFGYEVSRSLAACEGALLVVDATQGVQAQTLANLHQARTHNLTIIPIINKIDLPNARIEESVEELCSLGFREEEIIKISAKTGENVEKVLEAIVERIPSPQGNADAPLRALIFSSHYDSHRGVVVFVRVVDGLIGHSDRSDEVSFGDARQQKSKIIKLSQSSLNEGLSFKGISQNESLPGQTFSAPQDTHPSDRLTLRFLNSGAEVTPIEVGYFLPHMTISNGLSTGEVGYIATGLKDIKIAKVGDTITEGDASAWQRINVSSIKSSDALTPFDTLTRTSLQPLPGYKEPKPMVFLGLFPIDSDEIVEAREAMERLQLSDSAFTFRPISSLALGNGFQCGFLGLLHAEIVQERLQREFGLSMIATAPSVEYRIKLKIKTLNLKIDEEGYSLIHSASEYPDPSLIEEVHEPVMQVTIYSPKRYVGPIMQLSQEKRGEYVDMRYFQNTQKTQKISESDDQVIRPSDPLTGRRTESSESSENVQVELTYLVPLAEMIIDFFDALKSITEGYASFDYEFYDYQLVQLVKLDILVNHEKVDALSFLAVESQAHKRGKVIVERLVDVIPRQQFMIPVQAAIGGQIVARADVKPFRKDVIQKLYGGDRSRKDKLLDKQKKGKAKMKMVGRVEIPQQAFFHVLNRD